MAWQMYSTGWEKCGHGKGGKKQEMADKKWLENAELLQQEMADKKWLENAELLQQEMADKKWLENAELLQHRMNPTPENPETCSSRFEAPHQ